MKILYTNFHTGPGIGGHSSYILNLARALATQHTIMIAVPESSGLYRRALAEGLSVVSQSYPNRLHKFWLAARQLRRLINQHEFDLIHVNGSSDHRLAMLATLGLRCKKPRIVFTKHNNQPISFLSGMFRARFGTDCVITVCDESRRRLEHTSYRYCTIKMVRPGINTNYFKPVDRARSLALRQQWLGKSLPENALVWGSHAGTDSYKGWLDLVAAAALLPGPMRSQVIIMLAGALPTKEQLAQVDALGMSAQVNFVGQLDDVYPFLCAIDVGFVLSHREAISIACREMMAVGLPVLVSNHGGLPENLTSHQEGWIVPEGNISAIAEQVKFIFDHSSVLPKMGRAARQKSVQEFDLKDFVIRMETIYQGLTGIL